MRIDESVTSKEGFILFSHMGQVLSFDYWSASHFYISRVLFINDWKQYLNLHFNAATNILEAWTYKLLVLWVVVRMYIKQFELGVSQQNVDAQTTLKPLIGVIAFCVLVCLIFLLHKSFYCYYFRFHSVYQSARTSQEERSQLSLHRSTYCTGIMCLTETSLWGL